MSAKEQAIAVVSALPEDVTWPQAIELRAALDRAEQEIARGEGIPGAQAEQQIADMLKRYSPPIS